MKAKTDKSKKHAKLAIKRAKNSLKLAVIPHKENDYRPHIIRRYGLLAIVFIVIGLQLGYNGAKTGNVLGRESDITISSLFNQTNQARAKAGEPELKLNSKLNEAAYLKAKDMFAKQYWAHNAPDGTQPWKWLADVDYNYSEAGENLAKNFTSTEAVMTAWLGSPEHRANILKSSYQDVGFAVVDGELNDKPTSLIIVFYGLSAENNVISTSTLFAQGKTTGQSNIMTQFAVAFQSVTPAVVAGLILIISAAVVSIFAHIYRRKLPKMLRKSWYRHHGLYKATGLLIFGLVVIFLYGGGQI